MTSLPPPVGLRHPHLNGRFCSACGSPLSALWPPACACAADLRLHPRPCASLLAVRGDGRCLLVRRAIEPRRGLWQVPGGFMEVGESPEEAARRELREEALLETGPLSLLGVYSPVESALVVFAWEAPALGEGGAGDEVEAVDWFSADEIPWHTLSFTSTERTLHAWLRNHALPVPAPRTTWGG